MCHECLPRKLKTLFAAIGVLAILALLALYGWHLFENGFCETTVLKSLTTQDQSVKATVYRRECGAVARTRTLVSLSNAKVDGTTKGEVILLIQAGGSFHTRVKPDRS
jgi:hypothetical protein